MYCKITFFLITLFERFYYLVSVKLDEYWFDSRVVTHIRYSRSLLRWKVHFTVFRFSWSYEPPCEVGIYAKLPFSKKLDWISNPDKAETKKLYCFLCMLNYMLQTTNPTSSFKKRLKSLLAEDKSVSIDAMGFQQDWMNEEMWSTGDAL